MKLDKADLLRVLTRVKPGVAKKGIVEQFTHFIFTGKEIITYNDDISICHPFETDFKCSVKADDLFKILSGIKNDVVDIVLSEGRMSINTAKTRAGLATTTEGDAEEHVALLAIDTLEWSKTPADLIKGLFLCMFSASSDMTQGVLTCVYVNGDKINSSDEVRVSEYKLKEKLDMDVLIPARNVVELVSFDVKYFCIRDNWVHFKTEDNVIFSSRRVTGDFEQDCSQYFAVDGEEINLPKEFKEEIDSIAFMTEGEVDIDKTIDLQFKNKKIICKAEKQTGWVEKEIDFDFDHDITIKINPLFLTQILDKATTLKVGSDSALFVSDSFSHVIALPEEK
jgi:hypothetical protein